MSATYPGEASAGTATRPTPLVRAAFAVENTRQLDALARVLAPVADAVVGTSRRRDLLQGVWLGHATHPLLVAAPLGIWTGVTALDVFGGASSRQTCQTLTGLGVLLGVPSVLSGLAEWTGTNTRDRRTATAHALVNSVGLVLYVKSWRARRRGAHRRGAVLAAAGLSAVGAGGFLGGHLTQGRKVGSHHPAIAEHH
ncbi:DUF2231 domain-containing protein [Nocardioides sp. URHA0020]|uniref:DUF2231 domain-containing protein n=1 Tax=Nocardioides sp. URHA0020 TaxID=1380392 RepID=UPI00048EABC4|nr:DUF2231 domain-containing protein [Nocardioides sp. URHA0020]